MVTHMLLLHPKANTTEEDVRTVLEFIDTLEEKLPSRIESQILRNRSAEQQGYSYSLMVRCPEPTWEAMLAHPDYQRVQEYLQERCEHIVAFDGDLEDLYRKKRQIKEQLLPEDWQKKSVEERLKILLIDQLGVRERDLVPNASFVEDLDANSLDLVEIYMGIEEEFQITISDSDVEKMMTVGETLAYLEEKGVLDRNSLRKRRAK